MYFCLPKSVEHTEHCVTRVLVKAFQLQREKDSKLVIPYVFFFFFLPFTIGRLHQARRRNSVTELFFDYFTTFYFLHSDVVALYMDILFNNLQSFIYSMYRITPLYNNRRACSFLSIDDVHSNAPFLFKAPNKWQLCSFHLESLLNRLVFVSCTSLKN